MSTNPETPKACCNGCTRPMRPRGVTLKEMPGTMAWGHSGKCKSCVQPNGPGDRPKAVAAEAAAQPAPVAAATAKDLHLENTVAGLNSFMAARERRLRIQASKLTSFMETRGNRLPAQAPKAAVQRPARRAA